jgi:heat shock protein HslJ
MKMKQKIMLPIVIASLFCCINSCKNHKTETVDRFSVTTNPRMALNWADAYYGIVPCVSCSGIIIEITLNTDLSYVMKKTHLEDSSIYTLDSGTFSWNEPGTEISLNNVSIKDDFQHFLVQKDKLILLDTWNKLNLKSNIRDYTLFKVEADTSGLFNRQWELVEIMGKPVSFSGIHKNRASIYFESDGNVYGNLGCNTFNGTYTLQNGSRIQFSNVTNTLKSCHDMSVEETFKQILVVADNYFLDDNELILNRARIQPLAKFETQEQ